MDNVVKALRYSAPRLMSLPNVVGVGKGTKYVGGKSTGQQVVTVMVKKKLPKNELQSHQVVPKSVGHIDTDVIEVGEVVSLERTQRVRPARPGLSIGHYKVSAGTFGAVVYDISTEEPLILSNNHVIANSSNGKDGRAKAGDPIYQPGRHDGGTDKDIIARLYRFVPINLELSSPDCHIAASVERMLNRIIWKFRRNYQVKLYATKSQGNLVDAAVAKPVSKSIISADIIGLGVPQGIAEAQVGQRVVKSGRTSGTNWGDVRVVQSTVKVSMGDIGEAVFTDQIVTTKIAQPGDSGSIVLNDRKEAIGLLSAGSDSVSICGRIKNVCDALRIRF
jgi:hypothetical protein